jgi:ABC-type branched-subunit amino acid transport system substrate-binding protein
VGFKWHRRRIAALVAGFAVFALGVAGCGSSSSSSTASSSSGSSSATASSTTASAAAAPSKATGSPYVVGFINDDPVQPEPDQYATLQAEAKQINAQGGVNGHPVQVIHCSGQLNPNATTACARQFVQNSSMLATVGNFEANGAGATQILDAGGLAQLGNTATVPADYSCHSCFPFGIDSLSVMGEVTALSDVYHATKISGVWIDVPAARAYPPLIEGVIKASGRNVTFGKQIFVPPTETNFASVVAELQNSGATGFFTGLPGVQSQAFFRALAQAGNPTPTAVSVSLTYPFQVSQLPSSFTNHLLLTSQFKRTGAVYNGFVQAQDADGYPQQKYTDVSLNAYAALQMFVNIVKKMSNPTRASIVAAANNLTAYNTGLNQPLDFQAKSKILGGAFARLTNTQVYYYKVNSGMLVPVNNGQAYDLTKAP